MTTEDEAKAKTIVESWYWQMAEGHNFRWKSATKSMTLFYESAPLESDVAQLVIEYLKSRESVTEFVIAHKKWTFDTPWNAKDCWLQTVPSEKWAGTESTKVRVYWALVQNGDEAADGPYTVENGCKYMVSHSYYWNVAAQPELPASSSGVQYSIQGFTRDRETGLFTYVVEKRETVQQDVALYDTAVTAFELQQEEQHLGVKADKVATTGQKASVKDGVLVERRVTKNPDCTSDVMNRVTTEKNVKGAVKVWRKTLRGTIESTTERSAANPLDGTGLEVGETRRSEQTPGELWNNTVEKTTNEPVGEIASECQKTIFEHRDVKLENVPTAPEKEADEATDGIIKQKSVRKTDENTFDVTETTTKEKKVEDARIVERKTLRGTSAAVTHRNLTAAEAAAKAGAALAVGETRTVEKTPGDLKNLTIETTTPPQTPVTIAGQCEIQTSVHTDTKVEVIKAADAPEPHVEAEANKEKSVGFRLNEDGVTADKTTVTREWKEKSGSGAVNSGNGVVTTETVRKENTVDTPSAAGSTGVNKVVEIDEQQNDHGSKTTVKRVTTYTPQTVKTKSVMPTETVETTVTTHDAGKDSGGFNATANQGGASAQPNDHGSATTQVSEYTPHALESGWIIWDSVEKGSRHLYTYECGIRIFRNQPKTQAAINTLKTDAKGRVSVSASINRYGLLDGTISYAELKSVAERGDGGTHGGIQEGKIKFKYVSDYTVSTGSGGDMEVTPTFTEAEISTRTYYGRGNEGSEAAAAASSYPCPPGVQLHGRTYITSDTSAIIEAMHKASVKLETFYANRKARNT